MGKEAGSGELFIRNASRPALKSAPRKRPANTRASLTDCQIPADDTAALLVEKFAKQESKAGDLVGSGGCRCPFYSAEALGSVILFSGAMGKAVEFNWRCSVATPVLEVCVAFLCLFSLFFISVHFRRHTRMMENAPAMETQTAATEQPANAALPAAEMAEAPAPIAAPPGVPMKAPPSLLTKEEPKENAPAPEIGQLITLSEDLQVVRFTNGTIHLKQKGKDPEAITPSMFEALIQSIRTQANAPAPSAMSGLTGLASTNRGYHGGSSNHIRQDVISRLDKQGSVIRYEGLALQSLEADAIRRTVLIHGLPPFTTKSQIDHNMYYLLQQAQLTESDIQTTSNHVNTSTNAFLKITFLQESTSKHFFQTFKQKKRWYHSNEHEDAPLRIERDVPMLERIERTPLHAVMDSLTKPQPPALDEYLRCDFNSLQVWDNAEETLLAQVLYLPDKHLSYACYLLVVPRFFEEVRTHFPRFFGDKLASTIQFMQAYASASRHATTALRYHFSQTKDVSNLSREDAIRSFPYPIYPVELNEELSAQLSKNPNFILQGFLGMQTQNQQAVSDLGINLEDYGRKGKATTRNKGKGKGKRPERNKGYQSDMYRNQAEEEEDTEEDYKPKGGKGSWHRGLYAPPPRMTANRCFHWGHLVRRKEVTDGLLELRCCVF
ncbi:hypothetical protein AK812_SmicGene26632 [Symbiodinium microadriaticum]|uniref:Uncharacterized protein n=1 Tax=Symbiodinium microadriaticum TaxID=2951 RepID=A0A1Q9D905_SYMMI|nr:hypothetical protein AK812_SmicGene26632 [Symbiodinium microadriaticum]